MRLLYKTGPMESLRKWFYKPKRDDRSLLAQFFFADDALNMVAAELDSFDGRKDPERCSTLVNQLRHAQDRVLNITSQIMDQLLGDERVARGFRVKFPEDVLQDNLAGQLWFGAECLAAGSSIMNREEESAAMRPLAKALTRSLETVRSLLREQCLRPRGMALSHHDDMLHESLRIFDRLFAEFELCYVSAMVNVKTPHEFEAQQWICVLFSESLRRALKQSLLTQEQNTLIGITRECCANLNCFVLKCMCVWSGHYPSAKFAFLMKKVSSPNCETYNVLEAVYHLLMDCVKNRQERRILIDEFKLNISQVDSYDPALMFAVPRLAIVSGLLIYSSGPLSIDKPPEEMSDMFRPFRTLLHKIRSLLWTLDRRELMALERLLCTNEDISNLAALDLPPEAPSTNDWTCRYPDIGEFVSRFYADHAHCRELYSRQSSNDPVITDADYLPDNIEVMTPIIDGLRRLSETTDDTDIQTSTHSDVTSRLSDMQTSRSDDTFQDIDRTRKISKPESNDLSSLRNLSTNGLMMFDPLVINTVSDSRQLPDNDLVTSLNEQVSEIADRLSSIATDVDIIEHNHSFSTNDMHITDDFNGPRNEQLSCMPSTSHGYLIPNAISHEPAVLSSLSHNNSAVFNQDDESSEINNAINSELPLIIPDNIDADIVSSNIANANANLTSLLLTNEEINYENNVDRDENVDDKVKFMLGYESEHESAIDSGVSTENTSLDRSPETEQKDIKDSYMQQNRVLKSPDGETDEAKHTKNCIESSFSDVNNDTNCIDNDVTVNINYVEDDSNKNEAGSSSVSVLNRVSDDESNDEARRVLQDWGANAFGEEYRTIDEVITELRRQRECYKKINSLFENNNEGPSASREATRVKKSRKSSRNKRKKSKIWSPGIVLLDNRSTQQQNSPLRLNLDHFVDEGGTSCDLSECADDEQIALALQAQELAARNQARGKFKSSEDLIHRLFVCIAGVADQLQTNFAADLRNILKSVFLMNQSPDPPEPSEKPPAIEYEVTEDQVIQNGSSFDSVYSAEEVYADNTSDSSDNSALPRRNDAEPIVESRRKSVDASNLQASVSTGDLTYREREERRSPERLPEWVPDIAAPSCMRCAAAFTAFRRRHHCRNCGKVFCASCSSNSIPLPRYGQLKPVRVCEECFRSCSPSHSSQHR